jgi:Ni/Co efflux regulator RcnB
MTRTNSFVLAAIAALSLTVPSLALADPGHRDRDAQGSFDRRDQGYERQDGRYQDRGYQDRGGRDRYQERRHLRWDEHRHNGYMAQGRWYYGPPPAYGSYAPGYRAWSSGQYLAPYYRNGFIRDYSGYRLRPPPRGFAWVRAGDSLILINIRTGLIMEVVINNW